MVILCALLAALWLGGGGTRADLPGQVLVRTAAWVSAFAAILVGVRPNPGEVRPVLLFVGAALLIILIQLVPLPPSIWQAAPGRGDFAEAASLAGGGQPWRPIAIVPSAGINAAWSLSVPIVVVLLVSSLSQADRAWLPGMLLGFAAISLLIGLVQFSGSGFNNPLVNDAPGDVSALFANRNHFALFSAFGCLLSPIWAFQKSHGQRWRILTALALTLLFVLIILATGSRAGLLLGLMAIGLGLAATWRQTAAMLGRYPAWMGWLFLAIAFVAVVTVVLLSIGSGRATSITRVFAVDPAQDMRARGAETVLEMTMKFFPVGSGVGGFDQLFRMHEPFSLLKPTYFNHAHNDFLEITLNVGLPGLLLLAVALVWWAWASAKAWRAGSGAQHALPKLGSAMLLLIFVASVFDYPARTPIIMAMTVIAAAWLSQGSARHQVPPAGSALPALDRHI